MSGNVLWRRYDFRRGYGDCEQGLTGKSMKSDGANKDFFGAAFLLFGRNQLKE